MERGDAKTKSPANWRGFRSSFSVAVLAVLAVLAALAGAILLLLAGLLPAALLLLARLLLAAALLLAALLLTGFLVGILVLIHSISFQRWIEACASMFPPTQTETTLRRDIRSPSGTFNLA